MAICRRSSPSRRDTAAALIAWRFTLGQGSAGRRIADGYVEAWGVRWRSHSAAAWGSFVARGYSNTEDHDAVCA